MWHPFAVRQSSCAWAASVRSIQKNVLKGIEKSTMTNVANNVAAKTGRRLRQGGHYLSFIDQSGHTRNPSNGFLGKLLLVEAGQPTPQEEHTLLVALTRQLLDGEVGICAKPGSRSLHNLG